MTNWCQGHDTIKLDSSQHHPVVNPHKSRVESAVCCSSQFARDWIRGKDFEAHRLAKMAESWDSKTRDTVKKIPLLAVSSLANETSVQDFFLGRQVGMWDGVQLVRAPFAWFLDVQKLVDCREC